TDADRLANREKLSLAERSRSTRTETGGDAMGARSRLPSTSGQAAAPSPHWRPILEERVFAYDQASAGAEDPPHIPHASHITAFFRPTTAALCFRPTTAGRWRADSAEGCRRAGAGVRRG